MLSILFIAAGVVFTPLLSSATPLPSNSFINVVGGETQISGPVTLNGATYDIPDTLHILNGGSLSFASGQTGGFNITDDFDVDSGASVTIQPAATGSFSVGGSFILGSGGVISANTTGINQTAGNLTFTNIGGAATIAGTISANGVSSTNTNGGAINFISVGGALTLASTGAITANAAGSANPNSAGSITIGSAASVSLNGAVKTETTGAGAFAGPISITAIGNLVVGNGGVVSASRTVGSNSQGTAGNITLNSITGKITVQDTGTVKATSANEGNSLIKMSAQAIDIFGPVDVSAPRGNTGSKIELLSATTINVDDTGTHHGTLNATTNTDNPGGTVDVLARQQITVAGPTSGTAYALDTAGTGTNQAGGTVHVISTLNSVSLSGQAIRAQDTSAGGDGGNVTIQGQTNVTFANGTVLSNGTTGNNGNGGTIAVRAFNGGVSWTNSTADVSGQIGGTIGITYDTTLNTTGTTFNVTGSHGNGTVTQAQNTSGGTPVIPATDGPLPTAMTIQVSPTNINFGSVIVGAAAPSQNITVSEIGGVGPLLYTLPANPTGFNIANAGTDQSLNASSSRNHAVTLDTSAIATYSNVAYNITHDSLAVASPVTVTLSGAVLDHASGSINLVSGSTNFGTVITGASVSPVVFNIGDAAGTRANLEVHAVSGSGSASTLSGGPSLDYLVSPGSTSTPNYSLAISTATTGNYSATQTFTTADDQSITGHNSFAANLPLTVTGTVVGHATSGATVTAGNNFRAMVNATNLTATVNLAAGGTSSSNAGLQVNSVSSNLGGGPALPYVIAAGSNQNYTATFGAGSTPGTVTVPESFSVSDDQSVPGWATLPNATTTITGSAVANRVVQATSVDLGKVFVGASTSAQTTTLTTTGNDNQYTRVTLPGNSVSSGGVTLLAGTAAAFTDPTSTATRSVVATFSQAGNLSGSLSLPITGEGLAGESAVPVSLGYQAQAYDRGTASFQSNAASTTLTLNFGTFTQNSGTQSSAFSIFNLLNTAGFTTGLNIDSVSGSGQTSVLSTNLPATFQTITAGTSLASHALFDTSTTGSFAATYQISLSDDDQGIAGGKVSQLLTLNLVGTVGSSSPPPPPPPPPPVPPGPLDIVNPSFEQVWPNSTQQSTVSLPVDGTTLGMQTTFQLSPFVQRYVTGWQSAGSEFDAQSGLLRPDPAMFSNGGYDGANVAYVDNESFDQTLDSSLDPDTRYTLTFRVGRAANSAFFAPEIDVLMNSVVLAPLSSLEPVPAAGQFVTWTQTYLLPTGSSYLDIAPTIRVTGPSTGTAYVDDFSFAQNIPEPRTCVIVVMGGMFLSFRGRPAQRLS